MAYKDNIEFVRSQIEYAQRGNLTRELANSLREMLDYVLDHLVDEEIDGAVQFMSDTLPLPGIAFIRQLNARVNAGLRVADAFETSSQAYSKEEMVKVFRDALSKGQWYE